MREKPAGDAGDRLPSEDMAAPSSPPAPQGGAKIHELPTAKTAPVVDRPAAPPAPAAPPPEQRKPRRLLRRTLLLLGPLALIVGGGVLYLAGGRTVSTDNAYVKADKLNLTPEVAGAVARIPVREGEAVKRGQTLFELDDRPYRIALAGAEAQLGATRYALATLKATYAQNLAQIEQAKIDVGFYDTVF